MRIFNCVDDTFKKVDQLGVPVTFSYKKKNKFNTCLGGALSLLAILIIAAYIFGEVW
jgi:hypothetical protein